MAFLSFLAGLEPCIVVVSPGNFLSLSLVLGFEIEIDGFNELLSDSISKGSNGKRVGGDGEGDVRFSCG